MLSLEIIFVLGAIYSFLIYAMVKTQRAQREARPSQYGENSNPEGKMGPMGVGTSLRMR